MGDIAQGSSGFAVKFHDNGDGTYSPTSYGVGSSTSVPTAVVNGHVTVTTAGTRVKFSTATIAGVIVQALAGNTGNVYVGNSAVSAATGMELQPGQGTSIAIDQLSKVYVDAATNGDGVAYLGS